MKQPVPRRRPVGPWLVTLWRGAVGGLAAVTLVAALWAADVLHDRRSAPVLLQAVPPGTEVADHDAHGWADTVFVLVLGSDEREGLEGARSDAMHLVGINPAMGQATILNFPRDTWVEIPGHGRGRINTAYTFGGAPLAVETVERFTGIRAQFAATTTFAGLVEMVDRLGGLDVTVEEPMNDRNSGAVFEPGTVHMTGDEVLAFSRNRYVADGDLRRTENQAKVLIHALAELRTRGTGPAAVLGYLDVLFRGVALDGAGAIDAYRLARAALAIDPAMVRTVTMPSRFGNVNGASVVFPSEPAVFSLFADLADDAVLQAH